jgi:hypothetical protein
VQGEQPGICGQLALGDPGTDCLVNKLEERYAAPIEQDEIGSNEAILLGARGTYTRDKVRPAVFQNGNSQLPRR